jgi:hypothetical protein
VEALLKTVMLFVALFLFVIPLPVAARQDVIGGPSAFLGTTPPPELFASSLVGGPQQAASKSPWVAGLLSYVFPGVGSYYAGNAGHGHRHLLITLGLVTLVLVPLSSDETHDEDSPSPLLTAWTLAFVGNWVWSIVTAVQDANASNRAESGSIQLLEGVYLDPTVQVVASPASGLINEPGFDTRIALQLLRWRF